MKKRKFFTTLGARIKTNARELLEFVLLDSMQYGPYCATSTRTERELNKAKLMLVPNAHGKRFAARCGARAYYTALLSIIAINICHANDALNYR